MSMSDRPVGIAPRSAVQIRPAKLADRSAIIEALTAAYHEVFHALPRTVLPAYVSRLAEEVPGSRLMVATVEGDVLGVCSYLDIGPDGWIEARGPFAHPHARRLGVVHALVEHGERRAASSGAIGFRFEMPSFMPGAPALYRLMGYHRSATVTDLRAPLGVSLDAPLPAHVYRRLMPDANARARWVGAEGIEPPTVAV